MVVGVSVEECVPATLAFNFRHHILILQMAEQCFHGQEYKSVCRGQSRQVMSGILAPAARVVQRWEDQNGAPVGVSGQAVLVLASPPEGIDIPWHLLCAGENLEEQGHKEAGEIQNHSLRGLGQVDDLPHCSGCLQKTKTARHHSALRHLRGRAQPCKHAAQALLCARTDATGAASDLAVSAPATNPGL